MKGFFLSSTTFFYFLQKKSYLVTYSVYVQYDDYYSAFVNGKKHLHVNIVTYSDVHNKHLFFFFNFFYFLQKNHIRWHTVFMYNMIIFIQLSWTEKKLHVNTVTYSDVYNKHLFYMFKHVLTHYLLWYGPPVVDFWSGEFKGRLT